MKWPKAGEFDRPTGLKQIRRQRFVDLAVTDPTANAEDLFDGALADEEVVFIVLSDHHGHTAAGKVERNLIDFAKRRRHFQLAMDFHVLQYRHVEQILETGLDTGKPKG